MACCGRAAAPHHRAGLTPAVAGGGVQALSHLLAAVLGYWLDRSLFPKARPGQYLKHDERLMAEGRWPVQTGLHLVFSAALIRRALIVAAVCLAVAMGL